MFRRDIVRREFGYWDTVRFGADNELVRRIEARFGETAVENLKSGPLSFQRDSETSIVADAVFGVNNGPLSGVRMEYQQAQLAHHRSGRSLRYDNDKVRSPFAAPASMRLGRRPRPTDAEHFDVIIASDFRMLGGSTASNAEELAAQTRHGLRTGVFQMYRYDFDASPDRQMLEQVREKIDGKNVHVLTYGEYATCDLLILRYPPILRYRQKFIPTIDAKAIKVIVNQPPMSDYTFDGIVRYELPQCADNLRAMFGKDAIWYPIGPLVRSALVDHHADQLGHIELSPLDWHNIIDIEGWRRPQSSWDPARKLRIGRHSRDHAVKWPATREDVLNAYAAAPDIEVHVLGGATAPAALIGELPGNWTVYEFGTLHPREFLSGIDIFVYFSHPEWVEAFGRTIIEAMAVGVPAILPEVYRPLFGDSALYATPQTALSVARDLWRDRDAYQRRVDYAADYVRRHFSYDVHRDRLCKAGVEALARGGKASDAR